MKCKFTFLKKHGAKFTETWIGNFSSIEKWKRLVFYFYKFDLTINHDELPHVYFFDVN